MEDTLLSNSNNSINIINREKLVITGIKKLESFNEKQFIVITNLGTLIIQGSKLTIEDMLMNKGDLCIKGRIDSLKYTNSDSKKSNDGFFKKLFK